MGEHVRCWESALHQTTPLLRGFHHLFLEEGVLPPTIHNLQTLTHLSPRCYCWPVFIALCWDEEDLNRYTVLTSSHKTWAKKVKPSFRDMQGLVGRNHQQRKC